MSRVLAGLAVASVLAGCSRARGVERDESGFCVPGAVSAISVAAEAFRDAAVEGSRSVLDSRATFRRPLFVGNSLVEGMRLNSDDGFDFRCEVGVSLDVLNRTLVEPGGFDCVVVEMGSNELGLWSREDFVAAYVELLSRFDVPRFCLSVPPVNEGRSRYAPRVNNANVAAVNAWIRDVCDATGSTFVDCEPFFGDELRAEWTTDGLHLGPDVYAAWYAWVLDAVGVES